jgi:hypothetical protein
VTLSSSAYKYQRRNQQVGGQNFGEGEANDRFKGGKLGKNRRKKGVKQESWKDFLKEKVRETERERPTVLERKRGETERKRQGSERAGRKKKEKEKERREREDNREEGGAAQQLPSSFPCCKTGEKEGKPQHWWSQPLCRDSPISVPPHRHRSNSTLSPRQKRKKKDEETEE